MTKKLKKLILTLKKEGKTLALAESCSGGYASYLLTKIPGASKVLKGTLVVYSLDTKSRLLKISPSLLEKTQGVSKEVALQLAAGVRKKLDADIGAAIVGFASPERSRRAGTVFIAVSDKSKQKVKKLIIKGSRDIVRKKASNALADLLYQIYC